MTETNFIRKTCTLEAEASERVRISYWPYRVFYLLPTIDKPTRVRNNSVSLIDNIFVNNPDQVLISGNIITDVSDHFSQFCILKSNRDKPVKKTIKKRDFSQFSSEEFNNDLSAIDWMLLLPQKQIILMNYSHLSTEN